MNPATYRFCSGIIPFCYFNQAIYFLLGKSKRNNRLTTFSGKNEYLELDPCITAAREGYEETLGCILDRSAILERVRRCEEDHILYSTTPRGMPCFTYLIEIPYRRNYVVSFHRTREFLLTMGIRTFALQEMTDIKWLCAQTMFQRVRRTWENNGILRCPDQWQKIMALVRVPPEAALTDWRRTEDPSDDEIELHDDAVYAAKSAAPAGDTISPSETTIPCSELNGSMSSVLIGGVDSRTGISGGARSTMASANSGMEAV